MEEAIVSKPAFLTFFLREAAKHSQTSRGTGHPFAKLTDSDHHFGLPAGLRMGQGSATGRYLGENRPERAGAA